MNDSGKAGRLSARGEPSTPIRADGTELGSRGRRTSGTGPLSGLQILAIEQFGAGPFASLYFADLGADVIKIEDPASGGDIARAVPPVVSAGSSLYFETFNRGKRSIALDLKSEAGRFVFEKMVRDADAVFNNLRGDLPERLRLTYRDLGAVNPRVVCASLSAYGREGPRAGEPGYDALVQAESGWAAMTGEPDGPPIKSGLSLVDYAAGLTIAFGMLAAIFEARRTGRGRDVDTSLYETALSLLTYPATWWLSAGIDTGRLPMSAHPSIVPFQFFRTADGYVAIACAKEKFFRRLVELLGVDDRVTGDAFAEFEGRRVRRKQLLAILEQRIAEESTQELVKRLRGEVPCAPVRSMAEALGTEELRALGMEMRYRHAALGDVTTVANPLRFDNERYGGGPGPMLAQDRNAILGEIGFRPDEIERLEREGAFGR